MPPLVFDGMEGVWGMGVARLRCAAGGGGVSSGAWRLAVALWPAWAQWTVDLHGLAGVMPKLVPASNSGNIPVVSRSCMVCEKVDTVS